jgi:hypothetical protein
VPPHLRHKVRGISAETFQVLYVQQLYLNQVEADGPVAIAQGGAAQRDMTFEKRGQPMQKDLKKSGAEIDAAALRGGVQEDFDNEGDSARIRAIADGGTQKGFRNRSTTTVEETKPEPVKKKPSRLPTWAKILLAACGAAGAIAGAMKAYFEAMAS